MNDYYNLKQLEELSGGSEDFVLEIISVFISDIPNEVENLKSAFLQNKMDNLAKVAHKLKPSIDLLGITSISQTIRDIENLAKNNQSSSDLPFSISKVENVLLKVVNELKKDFNLEK